MKWKIFSSEYHKGGLVKCLAQLTDCLPQVSAIGCRAPPSIYPLAQGTNARVSLDLSLFFPLMSNPSASAAYLTSKHALKSFALLSLAPTPT